MMMFRCARRRFATQSSKPVASNALPGGSARLDHMNEAVEQVLRQEQVRDQREERRQRRKSRTTSLTKQQATDIVNTLASPDYVSLARVWRGDDVIPDTLTRPVNALLEDHGYRKRSNEFWYQRSYAVWYLANRMAPTASLLRRILTETAQRLPHWRPTSVFDYQAKLAPGLWATRDVWRADDDDGGGGGGGGGSGSGVGSIQSYVALESNAKMRALAHSVLSEAHEMGAMSMNGVRWLETFNDQKIPSSDLVICANSLGNVDLPSVLARLWAKTTGVLVILESGQLEGHSTIQRARDFLLSKYSGDEIDRHERLHIIAPCPHHAACAMAANKSICSFGHRMQRSSFPHRSPQREWKNRNHNVGDNIVETYSYLVVQKGSPRSPFDITALAQSTPPPPTEQAHNWSRIVAPPAHKKHLMSFRLCRPNGRVETRDMGKHAYRLGDAYKLSKKAKWGDLWHFPVPGDDTYIELRLALKARNQGDDNDKNNVRHIQQQQQQQQDEEDEDEGAYEYEFDDNDDADDDDQSYYTNSSSE